MDLCRTNTDRRKGLLPILSTLNILYFHEVIVHHQQHQVRMAQSIRTLIVDDSALVRARLVILLSRSHRIEVVGVAKTAMEALERAGLTKPDVVILDIRLSGPSGISIVQQLKLLQPAPLVIMLTNYTDLRIQRKCKEAGADFFFDKSSEFEKMVNILETLCGSTDNANEGMEKQH